MARHWICLSCLLVVLDSAPAWGFDPPVETAGPLTVRIVGPEAVAQRDTPLDVQVELTNKGESAVEGALQMQGIDTWQVEPAEAVSFSVPAGASVTKAYRVTAGPNTSRGHYPIHAWARFRHAGQELVAHPILVLQTKLDAQPWPQYLEWKAFETPAQGALGLWWLGLRKAAVHSEGQPAVELPIGWQGSHAESKASLAIRSVKVAGQTREAIAMHPPWAAGHSGSILCEFPLRLPAGGPLQLTFWNGVRPEGNGDGVTFRVRAAAWDAASAALGRVVWEQHVNARQWQPGTADLTAFAGQAVRLQLESHPGPKDNTSFDESYWGEPTLLAGASAGGAADASAVAAFPPQDAPSWRVLGTIERGGQQCAVRLLPGRRGLLDAVVALGQGPQAVCFRGFEARVCGAALHDPRSPVVLKEAVEESVPGSLRVRHRFRSLQGEFDLVGRLTVDGPALRAAFYVENAPPPRPWQTVHLEDVAAGPWSRPVQQVYAGVGNVIREPEAFDLPLDGHRLATSFVGFDFQGGGSLVQGCDVPPHSLRVRPAERHYSLHAPHRPTLSFIPAETVWEGAKTWRQINALQPAGGVKKLAGRFVFDLWGGRYGRSAEALRQAFRYGLTDAAVVWHNWQRWGYDYRLPDIWPPNPQFGTLEEMQELARTCKQAGVLFAPHDNYIDFYPDAEGFSYDQQIVFAAPGQPVRAWLHESRQAQSYRYRVDRIEPFLWRNVQWIRDGLAPTGFFIDVWSSAGPYDYWTVDGQFVDRIATRDTWGRHFAWIRECLGDDAPQISESGHDQLIGWLDGAQTNHLRVGKAPPGVHAWCAWNIGCADAERVPWLDAAHHDRFVLHGAGYPGRYEGGLDPRLHGIYSDDYMASEVLTGHPAMVSQAFSRDVVRKYWLLHALGRALALRTIEGVEFAGGDLHRQHVRWSGGAETWVNRGQTDWSAAGQTLPSFGFVARVPTGEGLVEVGLVRREGQIVEWARSPEEWYVNGRQLMGGPACVRLSVDEARLAGRQLELTLCWQIQDRVPSEWRPFLHFVREDGEIVFQAGQAPEAITPATQGEVRTKAGCTLPDALRPGESYELRYGFYRPGDGQRLTLVGPDDGQRRVGIGALRLHGTGEHVESVSWTPRAEEPDLLLARHNPEGRPVDFDVMLTAAGCRLSVDRGALLVVPLPQPAGAKFTGRIAWDRLPWKLPLPTHVEPLAATGEPLARKAVDRAGQAVLVQIPGTEFGWRLVCEGP